MAVRVHEPEVGLRHGIALLGREPVPPHRFGVVFGHALAVRVHEPEAGLRPGMALLCFDAEVNDGGFVVASAVCRDCVVHRPGGRVLHGREDDERRCAHQDLDDRFERPGGHDGGGRSRRCEAV